MQFLNYEGHYCQLIITGQTHQVSAQFSRNIKYSLYTMLFLSNTKHYEAIFFYTYSSTYSFLSPIPVSDWLIFCCGNSILHQAPPPFPPSQNLFYFLACLLKKIVFILRYPHKQIRILIFCYVN